MCVLRVVWLFVCCSLVLSWRSVTTWMSLNILYGRRRDWMYLLLLQLCQNTIVCLCADWVPNLHRLLWNQFWMPSDSLHVLFLGTHLPLQHPHIDNSCVNQVIGNSDYHFLDLNLVRNLPVFLLSKSTFWMWPLYTDTMAGHEKAFINLYSSCVLPSRMAYKYRCAPLGSSVPYARTATASAI